MISATARESSFFKDLLVLPAFALRLGHCSVPLAERLTIKSSGIIKMCTVVSRISPVWEGYGTEHSSVIGL